MALFSGFVFLSGVKIGTIFHDALLAMDTGLNNFQVGLGDSLYIFFQSVYFFKSLELGAYSGFMGIMSIVLVLALAVFLVYITLKTTFMKNNMAMMSTVLGEEAEVIEILDDFGRTGWIFVYGENWKFKSVKPLKVGDTVKILKNKKMNLIVEKVQTE